MVKIEFEEQDFKKLKELISEFGTYYDCDEDGKDKVWDFDDVDAQREIGLDVIALLHKYINIEK